MIYFSSDWHFGHQKLCENRGFNNLEEMDRVLIENINLILKSKDTLYFLGDFCWRASKAGHYRQRIKVRQFEVCRGNHDAASLVKYVSIMEHMLFRKFKIDGETVKFHLCHYPLLSWSSLHYGGYHLYGHSHGLYENQLDELFPGRKAMDVSIDNIHRLTGKWQPISLTEVLRRLE